MAVQYSYVMKGLTKTFPGAPKPVLNNIHLQFQSGTKIAIIGVNGAGKSQNSFQTPCFRLSLSNTLMVSVS